MFKTGKLPYRWLILLIALLLFRPNTTLAAEGVRASMSVPGPIHIGGDFTLHDNSTLTIDIVGATSTAAYDQLLISGSFTIGNNVTLDLNPQSYIHESGVLTIIEVGTNPITGTFAGLPEGGQTNPGSTPNFIISYVGGDGNDVTLTAATPSTVAMSGFAGRWNVGWLVGLVLAVGAVILWKRAAAHQE